MAGKRSIDARVFYGAAGSKPATAATKVNGDVTYSSDRDDIVDSFVGSDFKTHDAGALDLKVEIPMQWDYTDAAVLAFETALANNTAIAVFLPDAATGVGIDADWKIISKSQPRPINGKISVTYSLAVNTDLRNPTPNAT